MQDSPKLKQLHQSIVEVFSLEDLKTLCVYLNIHFDELGRGGLSDTARELLLYIGRHGSFSNLLQTLSELRPHIEWPTSDQLPKTLWTFDPFQRRDFYQHVNLPPHYVPRPELIAELRQVLLAGPNSLALTSAVPMNALHGMGGIGKSVAARALCDDATVQAAFPDGILWATVGQQPDLTARLREWIERLGGSVTQNVPTVDQLKVILADLLAERVCLLIADDVWKKEHAAVFQAGGPRCRLLITTRDAAVARELGATIQPVPQMTLDEAVKLLQQWAQGKLAAAAESLLQTIVARLKSLPLAVKLAGAQLERKEPQAWLEAFEVAMLKHRRVETVHDSLELTFSLSLNALNTTERKLYAAMSIFKEDEATLLAGVSRLWEGLGGGRPG